MSLADVLDPLQQPLFTVLDTPFTWTEVLGFGSGALCVRLVARQHISNWPIGIANNAFFILLFTQAGLYADAGLQVVFITLAGYGWWTWTHGGGPGSSVLPVRRTTRTEWTGRPRRGWWGAVTPLAIASLIRSSGGSWTRPGRREGGRWTGMTCRTPRSDSGESPLRLREGELQIPLYAYGWMHLTPRLASCVAGLRDWLRPSAGPDARPVAEALV
ncbi:nicotinamide riboside transporter PnuC [Streptomyces sp. NPDC051219]|uniref:nicotinamide riboside transporter PnuC n=1 Tax=Streptomyces sp. NPDC051219 TaxID=3155283 RepID=UPI00343B6A36